MRLLSTSLTLFILTSLAVHAIAQPAAKRFDVSDPNAWVLEKVVLNDGIELQGLIDKVGPRTTDFVEVRRPQGRPMYLLVRPLENRDVRSVQRISESQRAVLEEQIDRFRNKARFERGQLEDIVLKAVQHDGRQNYLYDGSEWFSLQSTADEEMTKRCVLRIEQIFAAYRRVLPPTSVNVAQPPRFIVFGSVDEYRAYLTQCGLRLENPSFFAASENLIVAGSNLSHYAQQLAHVRKQHDSQRKEQARINSLFTEELTKLSAELRSQGVSNEERRRIIIAYQKTHDDQNTALERRMRAAERRNVAVFDDVAARMFARLYHEAFHAYWANFLFPNPQQKTTRWLNEGLAQVFEGAILDGDVLRLDAPDPKRLESLQAELRSADRTAVADVLTADAQSFLVSHSAEAEASARNYLYSWGLAYWLLFREPALESDALRDYVGSSSDQAIPRFEELVGMSLSDFEIQWRSDMLALKSE